MSKHWKLLRPMLGFYSLAFLIATASVGSTVFLNPLRGMPLEPSMVFTAYGIGAISGTILVTLFHISTVRAERR